MGEKVALDAGRLERKLAGKWHLVMVEALSMWSRDSIKWGA